MPFWVAIALHFLIIFKNTQIKAIIVLKNSPIYDNFCSMKRCLIRKIIFAAIFVLFLMLPVSADVMPYYTGALSKETIGFLQVPKNFVLYLYPRNDSQVVDIVNWSNTEVKLQQSTIEPSELFAALIPSKNYAFCMVIDEQDAWYKIIYDKTHNKSAWIKPENPDDFWSLREFYSYYGKKHGLYYMKNIDYRQRGIYSGAYEGSQKLGGFTLIKTIRLNKISGNWALVTIVDMDNKPKIGYIRWREDDGLIIVFPKLFK